MGGVEPDIRAIAYDVGGPLEEHCQIVFPGMLCHHIDPRGEISRELAAEESLKFTRVRSYYHGDVPSQREDLWPEGVCVNDQAFGLLGEQFYALGESVRILGSETRSYSNAVHLREPVGQFRYTARS